ncbi:MAG TPA: DnaJ domain-containing protein [Nitrospiraceae bacterium]|jgi:molecular chaperone DnaJ|nr:DnaJ domain-containing protein [Nitrospiraceae bacterium]
MPRIDYYRVLGVPREASDEDIKKAYRRLVFQHHPDRNPGKADAEAKIREINEAYEVIGDPESRRTYDRLRWGAEPREEAVDPSVLREEMENKLFEEGRKELFAVLIKDIRRIKTELALIRERTVAAQGYDTFREDLVADRAAEIMEEFLSPEMETRKKRLVDVAVQMMATQGVIQKGDEGQVRELQGRFEDMIRRGRVSGFTAALELFYQRR